MHIWHVCWHHIVNYTNAKVARQKTRRNVQIINVRAANSLRQTQHVGCRNNGRVFANLLGHRLLFEFNLVANGNTLSLQGIQIEFRVDFGGTGGRHTRILSQSGMLIRPNHMIHIEIKRFEETLRHGDYGARNDILLILLQQFLLFVGFFLDFLQIRFARAQSHNALVFATGTHGLASTRIIIETHPGNLMLRVPLNFKVKRLHGLVWFEVVEVGWRSCFHLLEERGDVGFIFERKFHDGLLNAILIKCERKFDIANVALRLWVVYETRVLRNLVVFSNLGFHFVPRANVVLTDPFLYLA